jgi:branched-chain amino acid transport system permease protein
MTKRKAYKLGGCGVGWIVPLLLPLVVTGNYGLYILTMVGIGVLLASSLRVVFTSGQLSMGHGGVMAVGAYTCALLVTKLGWSSWAALAAGAGAAALVGLLVGIPFVRLKGVYFSLATVFLGSIITLILVDWRSVTGGSMGISNIPRPDSIPIPGLSGIDFNSNVAMYYLVAVIVGVSLAVMYLIEHSRVGLTFASVRESESLAESVGVNTLWYRVLAFTVGCLFAGLAGGLYAQFTSGMTPGGFGFIYSVYIMIYVAVGGQKGFLGPIVGSVLFTLIPEIARPLRAYQPFVFAGALMLVVFFLPDGLISLPRVILGAGRRRRKAADGDASAQRTQNA